MTKYAEIVFLQGDEAEECVTALCNIDGVVVRGVTAESVRSAVEYLAQWDMGEYGEVRDEIPAGSNDTVIIADGGEYVLTVNAGLTCVGLSRVLNDGE
jgi:hypothetical protein